MYLGIPHYELKNIASRPLLLHQAPISYLRETLDLWLRQCPTAESLISALEKLTYVGLSENIQQQIIQDEHRTGIGSPSFLRYKEGLIFIYIDIFCSYYNYAIHRGKYSLLCN